MITEVRVAAGRYGAYCTRGRFNSPVPMAVALVMVAVLFVMVTVVVVVVAMILVMTASVPMIAAAVLVTRHVLLVVPIVSHKVDPPAAGVIFGAMLCPVLLVARWHMQVDGRG